MNTSQVVDFSYSELQELLGTADPTKPIFWFFESPLTVYPGIPFVCHTHDPKNAAWIPYTISTDENGTDGYKVTLWPSADFLNKIRRVHSHVGFPKERQYVSDLLQLIRVGNVLVIDQSKPAPTYLLMDKDMQREFEGRPQKTGLQRVLTWDWRPYRDACLLHRKLDTVRF